ncbi:MAG: L-ribulose-5-phosphate 4-epimerase AraD [Schwartzia sp.]|nr:L-ribulose-5-phosphate 4-epimerase AraD [Schwartzia sp. (in: firmicutes)]
MESLKESVCAANLLLPRYGLVTFTWGNVSGIDPERRFVVIKPSGVEYERMTPADMVVVNLATGAREEGALQPSSDTATHLAIYRADSAIGGVVHTHSRFAVAWAQAGRAIPALGTTHADDFHGDVPCTRPLTAAEIAGDYEANTGRVIVGTFAGLDMMAVPAVLVAGHGPFAWEKDPVAAAKKAAVLEEVARMAYYTETLAGGPCPPISQTLLDKHYQRKHGRDAYYGQG